jgi:two-component system, NarL family, response regulator YdfI
MKAKSRLKEDSEPARRLLVIAASSARRSYLAGIATAAGAGHAQVATSGNVPERLLLAAVDVIIVDVDSLPMASATVCLTQSLPDDIGVVALADNPEKSWVKRAIRAGVNGILSREIASDELQLGIEAAEAGLVLLHPTSALQLPYENPALSSDLNRSLERLTPREQEVLRLVSGGLGNKEIGERLHISEHTVKFHISSVLGKLGAVSRTEAVSRGIKQGLIPI